MLIKVARRNTSAVLREMLRAEREGGSTCWSRRERILALEAALIALVPDGVAAPPEGGEPTAMPEAVRVWVANYELIALSSPGKAAIDLRAWIRQQYDPPAVAPTVDTAAERFGWTPEEAANVRKCITVPAVAPELSPSGEAYFRAVAPEGVAEPTARTDAATDEEEDDPWGDRAMRGDDPGVTEPNPPTISESSPEPSDEELIAVARGAALNPNHDRPVRMLLEDLASRLKVRGEKLAGCSKLYGMANITITKQRATIAELRQEIERLKK